MHAYPSTFFDYIEEGASRSAAVIVPLLAKLLPIKSVLDVGCGRGAWLRQWRRHGVIDIVGADGPYVDRRGLLIPADQFVEADLSQPIDLGRRFDLVQSLEVAEHLPAGAADAFVDSLARHGSVILFSAAVPGQGGEHHINERPYGYWRDKFRARGYVLFDAVRPLLVGDRHVEPWYRYNSLLFVAEPAIDRLDPAILARRVADQAPVADLSPLSYRLRRYALRALPAPCVSWLAIAKHKMVNLLRQRAWPARPDDRPARAEPSPLDQDATAG